MRLDDAKKVDLFISQYVYPRHLVYKFINTKTGLLHVLNRQLHFTSQVTSNSRFYLV